MSEVIGFVGLLLLVVAGFVVAPAVGFATAGVSLLWVAFRLAREGR